MSHGYVQQVTLSKQHQAAPLDAALACGRHVVLCACAPSHRAPAPMLKDASQSSCSTSHCAPPDVLSRSSSRNSTRGCRSLTASTWITRLRCRVEHLQYVTHRLYRSTTLPLQLQPVQNAFFRASDLFSRLLAHYCRLQVTISLSRLGKHTRLSRM